LAPTFVTVIKISLVICTYNRDKYLPRSLESIKQQDASKQLFELIVVDNNSTDNTALIAKEFIANNPGTSCRYCFEEKKGLSFARNRGMQEAAYDIISYVDDDAILTTGYIKSMVDFFNSHPGAVGVGGKVVPMYENGEPAWMSKYLNGFVGRVDFGERVVLFDEKMKYPAGCNMTYTKNILLKAGGFNNELTFRSDDKYIAYKIKALSDQIYYNPYTWVYHIIDHARLQKNNFKKLFLKTGNEEKKRVLLEKGDRGVFLKFFSYCLKLAASFILFFIFLLKAQPLKGKYAVLAQWYTLKGFVAKNVFVR
jgi:glycosyltransferase involved in cell wall biosynthesis